MHADSLSDTDILVVRSVREVGKALLQGTGIRLVCSATAGLDHVDRTWLDEHGIEFRHAPGANADSVADYVMAVLLRFAEMDGMPTSMGVVGCGQVGTRVARRAEALGLLVLKNDPPRARHEGGDGFHALEELLATCDVVTLHTPLIRSGPDTTLRLIDAHRLASFRGWLFNTSRGPVVDGGALSKALQRGTGPSRVALDVWEAEPDPDPTLIDRVDVATPHIAGYAAESKWNATRMVTVAIAEFLGAPVPEPHPGLVQPDAVSGNGETPANIAERIVRLNRDDRFLRGMSSGGSTFEDYRANYPGKRLGSSCAVSGVDAAVASTLTAALGCRVQS